MNNNSLNLPKLLTVSIVDMLVSPFLKNEKATLPTSIHDYQLMSEIKEDRPNKEIFHLGIYKNSKGDKAMAKMWYGKLKNFSYFTLQNEINLYEILNSAVNRTKKTLPNKFTNTHIPQLIKKQKTKDSLLLLTEFIEGNTADKALTNNRLEEYLKCIDYMKFLGNQLTHNEKSRISKRTSLDYIFLYPLLLTKAIYSHPRAIVALIKGIPLFAHSIPSLLQRKQLDLIHRDLHLKNIIISNKQTALIDLQFCLYSDVMYELVNTLREHWNDKKFRVKILHVLEKRYKNSKYFKLLLRGYLVNSATHALTSSNSTKKKVDDYLDCLKFALTIN